MIFSRKTRKSRVGRGALGVIALLLVSSAVVRLGIGAGQAVARATEADSNPAMTRQNAEMVDVAHLPAAPHENMSDGEISNMVQAFQARETRLAAREIALEDRMAALRVADQQVAAKLVELRAAEEQLRETIALAETASKDDLDRLTRVYESMKPKQAAALFEEMDPNFAAGFLGRMRPEAAAQIMAGLSPQAAHMFSVVLAGRNASVPKQ